MRLKCNRQLRLFVNLLALSSPAIAMDDVPLLPLPLAHSENVAKVTLGQRLFYEPKLSDRHQRSCATCHPLDGGGMDGNVGAKGLDGSQLRNTPSIFNVGYNYFYNWDGIVTTLADHTEKVLLNPKVMKANWKDVLATLGTDTDYNQTFKAIYPDGLTRANFIDALTSFERSLITPNARFDRFLRSDPHALTTEEQQGFKLFKELGCIACHQGINIGGNLFQKFGIFNTPNTTGEGRFKITQTERDRGVYRVPSLRNVAVTAPYFHDGRASSLEEAVEIMAHDQLGKPLATEERDLIIRFLQTLTGEYLGKPVAKKTTNSR
jgi:cytochrome c peroxidase